MHAEYELWVLEEYLTTVYASLVTLEAEWPVHLAERVRNARHSGDEGEWTVASQEAHHLQTDVIPRFHCNLAALGIYSTLEFCLQDISRGCAKMLGLSLSLSDLSGSDILDRSRKFFTHVARVPFCSSNPDWERLQNLSDVRNCIVHAAGRIDRMNSSSQSRLENMIKSKKGLQKVSWDDCMMVEKQFLETSRQVVDSVIRKLVQDAKAEIDRVRAESASADNAPDLTQ